MEPQQQLTMVNFRKEPRKGFHALRTLVAFQPDIFVASVARNPEIIQGMFKELLDGYNGPTTEHQKNFDCLQMLMSSTTKPDDFAAAVALQPEYIQEMFQDLFGSYDELVEREKISLDGHLLNENAPDEHKSGSYKRYAKQLQKILYPYEMKKGASPALETTPA